MKATRLMLACVCCTAFAAWTYGNQEPPKPEAGNQFKGKFLSVNLMPGGTGSQQLADVVVRELGGRSFLVGTSVYREEEHWSGGARIWLPMNTISEIVECDSIEELRRRLTRFTPPSRKPSE